MSDSVRPHRWQPTRLPRPWDSPGKNTGMSCHFLLPCMKVKSQSEVAQSCSTLRSPMDCSPPGSSAHGIFQVRVLEWVAISFSNAWKWKVKVKLLSRVRLLATPWTAVFGAYLPSHYVFNFWLHQALVAACSLSLVAVSRRLLSGCSGWASPCSGFPCCQHGL